MAGSTPPDWLAPSKSLEPVMATTPATTSVPLPPPPPPPPAAVPELHAVTVAATAASIAIRLVRTGLLLCLGGSGGLDCPSSCLKSHEEPAARAENGTNRRLD